VPRERAPAVSVILITKNEAGNLPDCLGHLMTQTFRDFEIVAVDSASTDPTVEVLRAYGEKIGAEAFTLVASPVNLTFGEARNIGIEQARGRIIAFVSADAYPDAHWLEEMTTSLQEAEIVYGRQLHAPGEMNAATASRGLRYHHFNRDDRDPTAYASNVNAGFRRDVFTQQRFDPTVGASEDVLFTRKARARGLKVAYNPRMIVHHKDVASFKGELRKHAREGYAGGRLVKDLGLSVAHLAWAVAILAAAIATPFLPLLGVPLLLGVLYAPTLRRLASVPRSYPAGALAAGVAVSPLFDLIFVVNYLKGLVKAP